MVAVAISGTVHPTSSRAATPTGYPFMQLAKRHGVDYGDVLNVADEWRQWQRFGYRNPIPAISAAQHERLRGLPSEALNDIDALLRQPVADRGGPHWCSCGKAHFSTEPCNLFSAGVPSNAKDPMGSDY